LVEIEITPVEPIKSTDVVGPDIWPGGVGMGIEIRLVEPIKSTAQGGPGV
jgi:hypothetical protein